MRKTLLSIAFMIATHLSTPAQADSSKKPGFGVFASFHGDPPPSMVGFNIAKNFGIFRLGAGVGVYNNAFANVPRAIGNYTVNPIGYALAWLGDTLAQVVTQFKVSDHISYEDYKSPYLDIESILSYGASIKIIPIVNALSPMVGVGVSKFKTNNGPLGLPDSKMFAYFPVGLDYLGQRFNLAAGYNFCPAIQNKGSGFYVNLGAFF